MPSTRLALALAVLCLLAGCSQETPPRSVEEFMRDELLLDSTLVRCSENRAETRYEPECINVREAVKILAAREERERRKELEAQSQRKREALRRTQAAVAEARRRAAEERRRQEEADYILQFGELPPDGAAAEDAALTGNAPTIAVSEQPAEEVEQPDDEVQTVEPLGSQARLGATQGPVSPGDELRAVREELKRRSDDDDGN